MTLPSLSFGPTIPVAFGVDRVNGIADDAARLAGEGPRSCW